MFAEICIQALESLWSGGTLVQQMRFTPEFEYQDCAL